MGLLPDEPALDEFAESCLEGQDLRVDITLLTCPGLSEYRSLHLFRMLQEILHNTIKHAGAKQFSVDVWTNSSHPGHPGR